MAYRGGFASGAFARMCGTTKNTLIHYDELGILSPSRNPRNGYREYAPQDYQRFEIIRSLVDAGFSLREVAAILDGRLAPSELQSDRRVREIDERIARLEREREMLGEIGSQLLEAAGPDCEVPSVVELHERLCVVAAAGQDAFDLKAWRTDRIYQDCGLLESLVGVSPRAFLSRYGAEARYDVRGGDKGPSYLWMLYLLPEGMEPSSGYASVTLPAGTYVQANYCGPWGGVRQAYDRVWAWAAERSFRSKGPGTSSAAFPRSTAASRATCIAAGSPFRSIHCVRGERWQGRLRQGQGERRTAGGIGANHAGCASLAR